MNSWMKGMRDSFFDALFNLAKKDKNVILITADIGAICHDSFRQKLSKQYINIGVAEQNMVGVAAGLAMAGKVVYIYSIVPFVTMRCYEQIRVDLCCMNLPVNIVGIGPGFDYSTLGPTHHGTEDIALMRLLPGMTVYSPSDSLMADTIAKVSYRRKNGPAYIRLDRTGYPLIYKNPKDIDLTQGYSLLGPGKDLYIITTGRMVYSALKIRNKLASYSISAGVIDLFRIPFDKKKVYSILNKVKRVLVLEEHFSNGGIGSLFCELFADKTDAPLLKIIGIPQQFCREYGSREYLYQLNKLDIKSITESIKKWFKK